MKKQPRDKYGLTTKHRKVLDLYLTCCNGNIKEAYSVVYPNANEKTVQVNAYRLLNAPESKKYVEIKKEMLLPRQFMDYFINSKLYEISMNDDELTKDQIAALKQLSSNYKLGQTSNTNNEDNDITIKLMDEEEEEEE